eukprot:5946044-Amphidinium_carterae.1
MASLYARRGARDSISKLVHARSREVGFQDIGPQANRKYTKKLAVSGYLTENPPSPAQSSPDQTSIFCA